MPAIVAYVVFVVARWTFRWWWRGVRSTWRFGNWLWNARQPDEDRMLRWLFRTRDVLGIAAVVVAEWVWRRNEFDGWLLLNAGLADRSSSVLIVVGAVVVSAMALVAVARPGVRLHMISTVAIPIVSVCATAVVLLTIVGASWGADTLMQGASTLTDGPTRALAMIAMIIVGLTLLWLAGGPLPVFMLGLLTTGVSSLFRSRDGHPLLEPMTAIVLSCWVGGVAFARSPRDGFPIWAEWMLGLGGPLIIIVLSLWQIHRIRTRTAVRFRLPARAIGESSISYAVARGFGWCARVKRRFMPATHAQRASGS